MTSETPIRVKTTTFTNKRGWKWTLAQPLAATAHFAVIPNTWAAAPRSCRYSLTHRPTGLVVCDGPDEDRLLKAAEELEHLPVKWSLTVRSRLQSARKLVSPILEAFRG